MLGPRIAAWRHYHGLTQDQLAAKCDVGRGAVANWETGVSDPSPRRLNLIVAAVANGDFAKFFGEVPTKDAA